MVNGMDETGWNVAAQLRWLWVAVSEQVTFCDILPGRGFDEAASILGADYKGWLTHDGWQVYYKFLKAGHQSCLNHLLDRAKKLIESASAKARACLNTSCTRSGKRAARAEALSISFFARSSRWLRQLCGPPSSNL